MSDLYELSKPFPKKLLGKDARGKEAVDHTVVVQRLLQVCGPYSTRVVEVLRSEAPAKTTKNGEHAGGTFVTGVVLALTVAVDGREVTVEETGGCENAAMKDGDGERLKHAMSDALKRCAMRLGLGLHMWAQDNYFLHTVLERDEAGKPAVDVTTGEVAS